MEREIIADGGVQYIPQITAVQQIIYLDIDGASTNYNGEILTVENVEVQDSGLSAERIEAIAAALNSRYADKNILFVTEKPEYAEYSTIYIGKTGAFSEFGNFTGLAETLDESNQNKTDQAFVMLDAASTNEEIAEIIAHEAEHITGQLNHGGEGLNAYAQYDITSGQNAIGITLSNDSMYVSDGGVAYGVAVSSGGRMIISSGGKANSTYIEDYGQMSISNGGVVNSTVVQEWGMLYILNEGTANKTTVNKYGSMTVSEGSANNTTVNSNGMMYIKNDAVAENTTVNTGGYIRVYSNGTAKNVVENGGQVVVDEGANVTFAANTITGAVLSNGAFGMTVHENTIANATTINSRGSMYIYSGGSANSTTVNSSGSMDIYSGGSANNTILNTGGFVFVYGAANSTTIRDNMYIYNSGVANATVILGGTMYIHLDGVAKTTTISGGSMHIQSGGKHRGCLQIEAGGVSAYAGAVIDFTLTDRSIEDGYLIDNLARISGAPTYTITVSADQAFGTYKLAQGAGNFTGSISIGDENTTYGTITVNGDAFEYGNVKYTLTQNGGNLLLDVKDKRPPVIFIYNNDVLTSSGVEITGKELLAGDSMFVSSGGIAENTIISNGGTATQEMAGRMGNTSVCSGGTLVLNYGVHYGTLFFAPGANVIIGDAPTVEFTVAGRSTDDDYLINDYSFVHRVNARTIKVDANQDFGTYKLAQGAENFHGSIVVHNGMEGYGTLTVNGEALVYNNVKYTLTQTNGNLLLNINQAVEPSVFVYSSGTLTSSGTAITGATLVSRSNNSMHVSSGGSAIDTIVNEYGHLDVFNGGTANNTTLAAVTGTITLLASGVANDTIINSGVLYFVDGGTANRTTVNSGGNIIFSDNGEMFDLTLKAGGTINGFAFAGDRQFEHISYVNGSFAIADNVTIGSLQRGMTVSNGGIIDGVNAGLINVLSGGLITNTRAGDICILNGGVASNTIFAGSSGDLSGTMNISSGAIHRGTLQIDTVTYCSAYAGAIIDFTLTDRTVEDGYLIDNISRISGAPTYTITVKANQAFGTYKLAQGAGNFQGTVTLCHGINNIGSITVNGDTFTYKSVTYSLTQYKGDLILDITDSPSVFISSGTILTSSGSEINNAVITGDGNNIMHVSNGGVANNTQVSDDGELVVSQEGYVSGTTIQTNGMAYIAGGSADATTLNDGYLYVSAGGAADNTTVNSDGWMFVDDGTINQTTVNVGGNVSIAFNGTATQIIENGGAVSVEDGADVTFASNTVKDIAIATSMTVHSNTVAENITLNAEAVLDVYDGGIANKTTINEGASIIANSGAAVNSTVIQSKGQMDLYEGAAAQYTSVYDDGVLGILEGAQASNTTAFAGGSVCLFGGGSAVDTLLDGGYMMLGEFNKTPGGKADRTEVNNNGQLRIYSGGNADNTTVSNGSMLIYESGSADNTTIYTGGSLFVSRAATASNTILNGGYMSVARDAVAENITLNNEANLYVSSQGTVNSVTVNSGANMTISANGSALQIKENGGVVNVEDGATVSFVANTLNNLSITNGAMTIHSNTTADKTTLTNGWMEIYAGGIANATTVDADGVVYIFSGGIDTNALIKTQGTMHIWGDGKANNTTVESGGELIIDQNGTANQATVTEWGKITVLTGGTLNSATADKGWIYMSGGTADNTTVNASGGIAVSNGAVAKATTVNDGGELEVHDGGVANGITVMSGGKLETFTWPNQNGTGDYTITNLSLQEGARFDFDITTQSYIEGWSHGSSPWRGAFEIKNGIINGFDITEGNGIRLHNGCVANNTVISGNIDDDKYAYMFLYDGAVASNTSVSGSWNYLDIYGGSANKTTVAEGARVEVEEGGTASSTTVNSGGSLNIFNTGIADNTTVNSDGAMIISNGGIASNTTVNDGIVMVSSGGSANSTTVNDGGELEVYDGGAAHGIEIGSGGKLETITDGKGSYTITDLTFQEGARWNLLIAKQSYIQGYVNGNSFVVQNGQVSNFTITEDSQIRLFDGCTANNTTILSKAFMDVYTGAVASNTNVYGTGATLYLWGGSANATTVADGGRLAVTIEGTAGGTATSTTINNGGSMDINTSAAANSTTINNGGSMTVNNGGTANNTYINADGIMTISSGGVANSTTVNSDGLLKISSGGIANSTTVYNSGSAAILRGGIASHTEIAPGGSMTVSSGGSVSDTAINIRGAVTVLNGGKALDTFIVSGGSMNVQADGYASGVILSCYQNNAVTKGGLLNIYGGSASDINIFNGGITNASSGSIIDDVEVNSDGFLWVWDNASASDVTIHSLASGCINGTADQVLIESGGRIQILDGANVTNLTAEKGADLMLTVAEGIYAQGTSGGKEFVLEDASLNGYTCESGAIYVSAGGKVTNIFTNDYLSIAKGASATNVTLYGTEEKEAQMLIRGTADQVTVFSHSLLMLESSANNVRIESGGGILMYPGKDSYINNCSANVGAVINGITLNILQYFYQNQINIIHGQVNDDWKYEQFLGSGHTATSTTISSGGDLKVYTGAIMTDTQIKAGGNMTLQGKHKGSLVIEDGGSLTAESGAVIDFTLTGRTAESDYLINNLSLISGNADYTITVSAEQAFGTYKLAQGAENFTGTLTVGNGANDFGSITVNGSGLAYNDTLYVLSQANGDLLLTLYNAAPPENLQGTANGASWNAVAGAKNYTVQYSSDNFASALTVNTVNTAVDTYCLPAEGQLWRVQASGGDWSESQTLTGSAAQNTPEMAVSDQDGNLDLFFANSKGIWGQGYAAQHLGSRNDWNGTGEYIMLDGKNKLIDIFAGSTDANILVMTDAANGDALFADDIYSALPGSVADQQSRIAQINEIRAGAGDDVVDMTSQRFEYVGNGVTIYGGLGNDTIWASNGENKLFGDAGNDRIVGGSGNDIIAGGAGNDSMHGGGGADTFCFGSVWGIDNIVQLASGSVTLWFESGSADNWNAETLTYSDGANSLTVSGIANESITLKFGDSASAIAGAFDNAASEKVYEDKDKALIA